MNNKTVDSRLKRICVYCGSNPGADPVYTRSGYELGQALAQRKIEVVYGGASIGVMGAVADGALSQGGKAYGVIPEAFVAKEISHPSLTELIVVKSMHERKSKMARLADGFIVLPGGMGTFEEIFEVVTWAQLGFHQKPCGILNINHYYDHLMTFLDHTVAEKFVKPRHRDILMAETSLEKLLRRLEEFQPTGDSKFFRADEI